MCYNRIRKVAKRRTKGKSAKPKKISVQTKAHSLNEIKRQKITFFTIFIYLNKMEQLLCQ